MTDDQRIAALSNQAAVYTALANAFRDLETDARDRANMEEAHRAAESCRLYRVQAAVCMARANDLTLQLSVR